MKRIAVLVGFLIVGFVAAIVPPGRTIEAQANCFQETGFCITTSQFADYFAGRGGSKTLGFPISRTFTLEGFQVQFFQRVVLQLQGPNVSRLNLLDPNVLPITRANQSVFPKPDAQIAAQAPQPSSPTYAKDVVQYIQKVSPNTFGGQQVNFFDTFNGAVPADLAFGGGPRNDDLLTLFNLEIWGLPTSAPAPDPGNGGFIYQRYQRGIMHFDASCGCTQGILVGEYLKAVMTGKNLPGDLAADMQGSRYLNQYNAANMGWLNRPGELKDTDLTGAFEPGTGAVTPGTGSGSPNTGGNPGGGATATPTPAPGTATPTPTPASASEVVIQVDDDLIDPGQKLHVTVIARNSAGLDWIEWQGDDTGDVILDDNYRFDDCDGRTECASGWDVNPVTPGKYSLRARARDKNGVRSDWVSTPLRVRDGPTPTPTPVTPTPTVGPGTPTVTPTPVAVLPTVKLQVSDDSINLGSTVDITIIASSDKGLDWIQWEGDDTDDPELDSHRFNCDNRKDCARTWTVKPTQKGSLDILGDVKDQNGVRGTTVRQELRVR
jgi:hypothetical protein